MHIKTKLPLVLFLWIISIATSNSLPKGGRTAGRRHSDLKLRTAVKRDEMPGKSMTKVDSQTEVDSPSEDDEYSNSILEEPVYSCEETFAMTDIDGDGRVTETEYRTANPNMTDLEVSYVFQRYDPDADGDIYLDDVCGEPVDVIDEDDVMLELATVKQSTDPMDLVDCRTLSMELCDQESFLVVWNQIEGEEAPDTTVCRALEAHITCVIRENEFCDLDAYVADVKQTVASFIHSGICPNIHMEVDDHHTVSAIPATGVRQVRSTKNGLRSRLSNSLKDTNVDPMTLLRSSHTCLRSSIQPCNTNFISSLRSGSIDPCETLVAYRRCARKSTRRCQDRTNALRIRDGIKAITRAHRRAKLCE